MKKLVSITLLMFTLISCGSDSKPTKEDLNAEYEKAGEKYFNSLFKNDPTGTTIRSVKFDSLTYVSSQQLAVHNFRDKAYQYDREYKLFEELEDIDKSFSGVRSEMTQRQADKTLSLVSEIESLQAAADKLSKKDTVAYAVRFKVEMVLDDGTVDNLKPILWFNLNRELDAEWNRAK